MWFIPSRQRPHRLEKLMEACRETNMSTPAAVLLDEDDPCLARYLELPLLPLWSAEVGPRAGLSAIYNRSLAAHPGKSWYGVLCDDAVPKTDKFDKRLSKLAGKTRFAVPVGAHDDEVAPHFVVGGDLVREMGWISLPGLERIYIDTVWDDIARKKGVYCKAINVIVEHHHFSNGMALMDATYKKPNKANDKTVYDNWYNSINPGGKTND